MNLRRGGVLTPLLIVTLLGVATCLAWANRGEPLVIRTGVGSMTVTGARAGDELIAEQEDGRVVEAVANEHGGAVLTGLDSGSTRLALRRDDRDLLTRTVSVPAIDDPVDLDVADLTPGLNYIPTRDGTLLSAWVTLPGPIEDGPYPTVVELSVYRIGDEGDAGDGIGLDEETTGTQPATAAGRALGYATVGVNLRGTGCSGGALDFLGTATAADGHDVIETVAAQPWVANEQVGLVGYSFGALAALRTAATNPPSLAGVAALSVYGDAWTMFHPGGLDNRGFPVHWLEELDADAGPSRTEWVRDRIDAGDQQCAENQVLRDQRVDPAHDLIDAEFRNEAFNRISVTTWAPDIEVPVLVAGQFQDAALGADLASYFDWFTNAPTRRLVVTNGSHGDGISPQMILRYAEFLDLVVARRIPRPSADVLKGLRDRIGVSEAEFPGGPPTAPGPSDAGSREEAWRRYEEQEDIEIIWGSGAAEPPGSAAGAVATRHGSWPPGEVRPETRYLAPEGRLEEESVDHGTDATYRTDGGRAAAPWSTEGSDLLHNAFDETAPPTPENTLRWTSDPSDGDLVLAGTASVDLWLRSDRSDVDLQAVLYEVDANGDETFIQNGWARAGFRRETDRSTPLHPVIDFDRGAYEPLVPGTWTRVRVGIPSFAHVVHSGSRIRLQIGTPGDRQVQWLFGPQPDGDATIRIGQSGGRSSSLTLPVADLDVEVPPAPCGSLRAQPCRSGVDFTNTEVGP